MNGLGIDPDAEQLAGHALSLMDKAAAKKYVQMALNVARRAAHEGATEIDPALNTTSFVLDDTVVVLRHAPDTDAVELYADLGLPPVGHQAEDAYARLLELNLQNPYPPGILFGRHPDSRRIVAFFKASLSTFDEDGDLCLALLERMVQVCKQVRSW